MPTAIRLDEVAEGTVASPGGTSSPFAAVRPLHRHLVRIACHLAAELPLVIICIRSMATGWRPTSDDAVVAWRAWDVLSAHPTLVGAPTHATGLGHQAFAPGPALSWLLAVPVHLDPAQGALWGSTLVALAAVALAIEAGWATGARWGALGAAATALTVATTETAVLMNLPWTPWQGALWMVAALVCAWATGTGRWRWWPACVVSASIAAQAHVVFALTAVAVCGVSPLLGWISVVRRRSEQPLDRSDGRRGVVGRRAIRPLLVGLLVGVVLWLPPIIDELWGGPGNLTLLWRSSHAAGGRIGYSHALQGLGAATWPPLSWAHRLPTSGQSWFFSVLGTTFHGAPWHGVVTLLALVGLASWCTATGRRVVAGLAWVSALAGLTAVVTIAQIPEGNAFQLVYLGVLFWPVGLAATGALAAGLVVIARTVVAGRVPRSTFRLVGTAALTLAVAGMIGLSVGVTVVDVRAVPNSLSVQGGPSVAVLADRATTSIAEVAPHQPFELELTGTSSVERWSAAVPAIAYGLIAKGLPVRLPFAYAVGADAARSVRGDLPVVKVDISSQFPSVRVVPPRHDPTRTPSN